MVKSSKHRLKFAALTRREGILGLFASMAVSPVSASRSAAMMAWPDYDGLAVPSQAILRRLPGGVRRAVYLSEGGREGRFIWTGRDVSAQVASDVTSALYLAPITDSTGRSGAWVREVDGPLRITWFGAVGDGMADDTDALVAALDAIEDWQTLDFAGLHLNIFVGVTGTGVGDAQPLRQLPRLFRKKGVTLCNGIITADRPSESDTKLRYPTTLTVDGCEDVTLRELTVHSKGESFGDTDASLKLGKDMRRGFAAQNGGHAILVVRSRRTRIEHCRARLCGSVGSVYVMSSEQTTLDHVFSNPGSLGYAAFAFDSWAGNASESGFAMHDSTMTNCSASRENYRFGSKGCVLTEDADVSVTVKGGYFADAYPNEVGRDLGYAFGCSSSRTIVENAMVENCASIGYTGTTTKTDYSYLEITNVEARKLRKTVHQTEATSFGRMYWKYRGVKAAVKGTGIWWKDPDLSRRATSYLAMPNRSLRVHGLFEDCEFTGATYGFVNTYPTYGLIQWRGGTLETRGFLWDSANIGGGAPGFGGDRGIQFNRVSVRDVSEETGPYSKTASNGIYTHIDVSTSAISLERPRPLEERRTKGPSERIERYSFPRPQFRH